MDPLKKITASLQHLLKPQGTKRLNPSRDWMFVLASGLVLIFASMFWNAWFFFAVLTQDKAIEAPALQQEVDASSFQKAQELFQKREAEEARYRNEYRFIDPSH